MANTKTTTKSSTATTKKTDDSVDKLQAQLEAQQKQIEQLMALLTLQNNVVQPAASNGNEIGADEEILVVSLVPNKLNLIGEGGVVAFAFDDIYEEQYIDYATLKEIVRLNRQMAKNGRFYIMDERVVNKLRLKNDYKNILTPEQLKNILDVNVNSALELYKMAPVGQKGVIVDIVKQKKFSGTSIDYNLLSELSKISGVDLVNIEDATQIEVSN